MTLPDLIEKLVTIEAGEDFDSTAEIEFVGLDETFGVYWVEFKDFTIEKIPGGKYLFGGDKGEQTPKKKTRRKTK